MENIWLESTQAQKSGDILYKFKPEFESLPQIWLPLFTPDVWSKMETQSQTSVQTEIKHLKFASKFKMSVPSLHKTMVKSLF